MVRYVYIIGKGEFEITIKTFDTSNDEDEIEKSKNIIGFLRPANSKVINSQQSGKVKINQTQLKEQKCVVMGPGKMLGLEDIARLGPHSYSARCVS